MSHEDSGSFASSVAPTVVPSIVAGRPWTVCAVARSSLAGAGTWVGESALRALGGDFKLVAEPQAEDTVVATTASPARDRAPVSLWAERIPLFSTPGDRYFLQELALPDH